MKYVEKGSKGGQNMKFQVFYFLNPRASSNNRYTAVITTRAQYIFFICSFLAKIIVLERCRTKLTSVKLSKIMRTSRIAQNFNASFNSGF